MPVSPPSVVTLPHTLCIRLLHATFCCLCSTFLERFVLFPKGGIGRPGFLFTEEWWKIFAPLYSGLTTG